MAFKSWKLSHDKGSGGRGGGGDPVDVLPSKTMLTVKANSLKAANKSQSESTIMQSWCMYILKTLLTTMGTQVLLFVYSNKLHLTGLT